MKILLLLGLCLLPILTPAQEIKVLSSSEVKDQIYTQKPMVLNLWATWCVPCVKELPYFNEVSEMPDFENLNWYFASLDFENQIDSKLKPFLSKNEINGKVFLLKQEGGQEWIDIIHSNWSGSIPATVLINQEGEIAFYEQSFSKEELITALKKHFK